VAVNAGPDLEVFGKDLDICEKDTTENQSVFHFLWLLQSLTNLLLRLSDGSCDDGLSILHVPRNQREMAIKKASVLSLVQQDLPLKLGLLQHIFLPS